MFLKVALNGARSKSENQYIPQSLDEIEQEVINVFQSGFKVFHIHCYDKNGDESLKPADVNNLILRLKNISTDIQIGISSGDWIEPSFTKRLNYIESWNPAPDFVSVNMIETDAIEISKALIKRGILVEAGLNEKKAAEIFVKNKLYKGCCRVLIEPEEENFENAIKTINEIEIILDTNNVSIKRLLHGFNTVAWDILREAKKRGYNSRIGMEDTIYLENGNKVKSNMELLIEATKIINSL